jgi:hypothetical protein
MATMRGRLCLLVAILGVAVVGAGCGATSPTPTAAPICGVLVQMHQAREALIAAFSSAQAGQADDAMKRGADARQLASNGLEQLRSLGAGSERERALRDALSGVGIGIDQTALLFVGLGEPPAVEEMVRLGRQALPVVDQTLGTADAIAQRNQDGSPGPCVALAFGSPLPTLPPVPTPEDGPSPPGSLAAQKADVLEALGLKPATDIEFGAPPRIRWLPTVIVDDLTLENRADAEVRFPFDLTVLRWDGQGWQPMPCPGTDPQANTNVGAMCGVLNTNAQRLPAWTTLSSDDPGLSFFWPGTEPVPPATYALVVPIWRSADEYPTGIPSEGAVAIVTLSSTP